MLKETFFRLFALILCLALLVPCIAACSDEGGEDTSASDTESTPSSDGAEDPEKDPEEDAEEEDEIDVEPVLRDDCWYIGYKNVTTYSLVRSEDAMNLVKAKLLEIQESFKRWTAADPLAALDPNTDHLLYGDAGADFILIEDASQITNQEIVIGQVGLIGREEIEERAKEKEIGSADFFIEVREDGDIWIVGGSNTATVVAVDFAINRVFDVNTAERYICVEKGYSYTYHHGEKHVQSEITRKGDYEFEFVHGPNTMADVFMRLTYSTMGGWRLQNKYSYTRGFDDTGAAQLLSLSIGEEPNVGKELLSYHTQEDGSLKIVAPDGSYAVMVTDPFTIDFYTAKGELAQSVIEIAYTMEGGGLNIASVKLDLKKGEPIYGSGQRFDDVNLYGKNLVLYSTDVWDNLIGTDSKTQSQITVPFFTNVRGSGVFMNRNEYMVADIGDSNPMRMNLMVYDGLIDLYVFTTDSIADAISRYCDVSGANAIPEDWTYGMISCRAYPDFSDKDRVLRVIAKMEQYSLPWNGVVIQGWTTYDAEMHEELKELCDQIHAMGKKVIVYVSVGDFPNAEQLDKTLTEEETTKPKVPTANYFMTYRSSSNSEHVAGLAADGKTKIYDRKIPNCDAELLSIQMLDSEQLKANDSPKAFHYIDLTNQEAVDWFFGEYWETLLYEIGVDGAKIDLGYMLPDTAGTLTMSDASVTTEGAHHWYATAFAANLWKKISEKADSGIALVRGGGIGSQRLSYVSAPDQARDFNRLQRQLTAMLSCGLSGIAFTTFDIGGSTYSFDDIKMNQEAAILLRSLQMSAFSPAMQTAGSGKEVRLPYEYAEYEVDGETPYAYVTELYKAYSMLHEALVPYLSECAVEANATGMPVVRHLVLHYADDSKVYNMNDQYMLGDAFLVAPMLPTDASENASRDIYLPEGKWQSLLDGETYEVGAKGMTLKDYAVSSTLIPVFYNLESESEAAQEVLGEVEAVFDYIKTVK